jgi:hypothetical protein
MNGTNQINTNSYGNTGSLSTDYINHSVFPEQITSIKRVIAVLILWHEKCPTISVVYMRYNDAVLYTPKIQEITTTYNKPWTEVHILVLKICVQMSEENKYMNTAINLRFPQKYGILWSTNQLSTFQEIPCSLELINNMHNRSEKLAVHGMTCVIPPRESNSN